MAVCSDFKDRKGCGRQVTIKPTVSKDGKERMESFTKLPCFDNDGQFAGKMFVPHYFGCPEQQEFAQKRLDQMDEEFEKWKAANPRTGGQGGKPNGGGGSGGQFRGRSTGGGGYPQKDSGGFRRARAPQREAGEEG